jgi:hypothetical protein
MQTIRIESATLLIKGIYTTKHAEFCKTLKCGIYETLVRENSPNFLDVLPGEFICKPDEDKPALFYNSMLNFVPRHHYCGYELHMGGNDGTEDMYVSDSDYNIDRDVLCDAWWEIHDRKSKNLLIKYKDRNIGTIIAHDGGDSGDDFHYMLNDINQIVAFW